MKNLQRREFLKKSALGVGGLLVGAPLGAAEKVPPQCFDPYELVPLGKSGLKFSRVCMGTGMRGGNRQSNQTRLGREPFQKLLRDAYERGVRTYDLADLYGSRWPDCRATNINSSAKSGGTVAVFPNPSGPRPRLSSPGFCRS